MQHFNLAGFYAALDSHRQARRLTWKEVAAEVGLSASTLTRLGQGKYPDVEGLAALLTWLKLPCERFLPHWQAEAKTTPLAQMAALLHTDPRLSPEHAAALVHIVTVAYLALRQPQTVRP